MDRPTKFREISEALRLSMPAEQSGGSDFSAKAEEGAHTTGSEDDSAADQSDGHSPDEVRVRPYEQTRRGKTVPVRGYMRHHTLRNMRRSTVIMRLKRTPQMQPTRPDRTIRRTATQTIRKVIPTRPIR